MKKCLLTLSLLTLCGVFWLSARAGQSPQSDAAFFEKQVRPVLEKRCFACHSGQGTPQANLRLDSKAGWLRGGVSGPAIVPGDVEKSLLLKAIRYKGEAASMPPTGKLPDSEIALLTEWIKRGAPAPDAAPPTQPSKPAPAKPTPKLAAAKWWAFQPIKKPVIPYEGKGKREKGKVSSAIGNRQSKIENPIDAFILAKLEAKGLKPSPPADKRTLIRRATFDLHGLPPTPAEVEAFLKDNSPNAYAKVVDRLLASPRYGERWGRHWLDVVHYGDTHGYDKDKRRDNAWRYRDYVIRALNSDKPYDRFVREQLAGDVLFPDDPDGILATGFIAAGPWDFVGHLELAEGTVEKAKTRNLDRDDMVATAMSTFTSVTIHCARCHDHKFDPIPQKDYYKLQAVFAGVERGDRMVGDADFLKKWNGLQQKRQEATARRTALLKEIGEVTSPELRAKDADIQKLREGLAALPPLPGAGTSPTNGYHSAIEARPDVPKWVQVDLGKSVPIETIVLIPARPTDFADTPGFGFPLRLRVAVSEDAGFAQSESLFDPGAPLPNPGNTPLILPAKSRMARFVRVTALELWPRTDDFVFALAEVQVLSGGKNVAKDATVTALDSIEAGRWSVRNLVDGFSSRDALPNLADNAAVAQQQKRSDIELAIQNAVQERQHLADSLVKEETREALTQTEAEIASIEAQVKAMPSPERVYAVLPRAPRPIQVLSRGEVEQPLAMVGPGALTCLPMLSAEFTDLDASDEGKRRAALADWIVSPNNTLTWRSIVNRVWHYHFGRGLVDTPNDFGKNGGAPSHPELLDWLAATFVANDERGMMNAESKTKTSKTKHSSLIIHHSSFACGQSLKKLHRLIMLSATYCQSSQQHSANAKIDGDNRYLWRMNRMRLDAEATRDTVLAVAGTLDLTMGGPAYELFRFKDDHSPIYDHTDPARINDPKTWRRTVYRFVVRSVPNPFLECLDCADPNINTPVRNTTLTALQSLALLNDPFMVTQAQKFAEHLASDNGDISAQIERAYMRAFGRLPKPAEKTELMAYAGKYGLPNACRLLFNMSEFVFVD